VNDRERIAVLEHELADLKATIAAKDMPKSQPARPVDDGPTVTFPHVYPIQMPSSGEYSGLLAVVRKTYPKIAPTFDRENDRREFFEAFVRCFERIATLRRLPTGLNYKRDARDWAFETAGWLQQRGTPAEIGMGAFMSAVIAAGDISFALELDRFPLGSYVSLTYDQEAFTASTAGWRGVLANGKPREPVISKQQRAPQPQQVRIYG